MPLEPDLQLDRRRLKRRLLLWRVAAIVILVALLFAVLPRGRGGLSRSHITRISVSGLITDNRRLVEQIEALAKDSAVPAVILAVDSPGGTVAGGESLHDAVAHVAAQKPVAVTMGGTAASAAYMISAPATRIFARNATLTGSIGVILETGEVSGLLGKLGITADALTSGPLKDQPSFTRPLSPEGRAYLHGVVMDLYDQFVGIVASGRHLDEGKVRSLADGRAYTGRQALGLGLIDQIGGEHEARLWLAHDKHVSEDLPIQDLEQHGWFERSFGKSPTGLLLGWLGLSPEAMAIARF